MVYEEMSKKALIGLARERGIKYSGLSKEQLAAALQEAQAPPEEEVSTPQAEAEEAPSPEPTGFRKIWDAVLNRYIHKL